MRPGFALVALMLSLSSLVAQEPNPIAPNPLLLPEFTDASANHVYSPLSTRLVMAPLYAGAVGQTANELALAFSFPMDRTEHDRAIVELLSKLQPQTNATTLDIATSFWYPKNGRLQQGFSDSLKNQKVVADGLDFSDPNWRFLDTINDWVKAASRARIDKLLDRAHFEGIPTFVAVNAIYFESPWETKFSDAGLLPFHLGPGKTSNLPFMRTSGNFAHLKHERFEAVSIPYKGKQFSLCVVLPKEYAGLTATELTSICAQFTQGSELESPLVYLSMPPFKIETAQKLRPLLERHGVHSCFTPRNEFARIFEPRRNVWLSAVVQKAIVEVNNKGTVASAATAASAITIISNSGNPVDIRVNRPFYFFVLATGVPEPLFIGRCADPTAAP